MMKVLIVDDERLSRRVVEQAVQGFGHECLVAGDGEEAWKIFQQSPADVVIKVWLSGVKTINPTWRLSPLSECRSRPLS